MARTRGRFLPSEDTDISPEKARTILEEGEIGGEPLTDPQKGFFGALAGMDNGSSHKRDSGHNTGHKKRK